MDVKELATPLVAKQHNKYRLLTKQYRKVKQLQASLLALSELANSTTNMDDFYQQLHHILRPHLALSNLAVYLKVNQQSLQLSYCQQESRYDELCKHLAWLQQGSLTQIFTDATALHYCVLSQASQPLTHIALPLTRQDHVCGVLVLEYLTDNRNAYEQYQELLSVIAKYIMVAVDRIQARQLFELSFQQRTAKLINSNKQLQTEIVERQRAEKLHKALIAISSLTSHADDLTKFYQQLHLQLKTIFRAENCYIALQQQQLTFPYYVDEFISQPAPRTASNGLTEWILTQQRPSLLVGEQLWQLTEQGEILAAVLPITVERKMPQAKAWLAAPLVINQQVAGVLAIQDYVSATSYQQTDLALMKFVAEHIAIAIERQQELHALEQLVAQRTRDLQQSNHDLREQINQRKLVEQRLYHDAHHDALTRLPNRALFNDRLSQALKHLKRFPAHRFSVLFIDLDRFKLINDTLGHQAGDQLLITLAQRLQQSVRENDVIARLGGDEFVVLLDGLSDVESIEEIAQRIIDSIAVPVDYQGNMLHSSASIGITICQAHYQHAGDVLRDADAAMYQAKNMGRGRYIFFDVSMREQLLASMTLEQELHIALEQQQFQLFYQPIVSLQNEITIGYEALLRWQHPNKGLLTPSEFFPLAEEVGLITDIETWVLSQVQQQLTLWQQTERANQFVSVNLSATNITQVTQFTKLCQSLNKFGQQQHLLMLEFDEQAFMQQADIALKHLRKLEQHGVRTTLDDFGAGYSSINLVHNYPFDFIKLDRKFVRSLQNNSTNQQLFVNLLQLSNIFQYRFIATGIESAELLAELMQFGCEFGQGFALGQPKPYRDIQCESSQKLA